MNKIILKINEIPQQHVGKGRAIIDPKIIEEQNWNMHVMDMLVPEFQAEGGVDGDDAMALVKSDVDEFMNCPSDKDM